MQNMQTLVSGSTTFGQLYALLNNNMTTLASQFSGSTFPANPTTGQPCYRTDKNPPVWYIFNGTTWEDGAMASAVVTALLAETQKARGTAATLDARLDVALNADGTLKAPTPAGGWWTQETGTIARVSASIFSVAGDRRQIYTALRAVRLAQNTDADSHVVSCSYAAESDLTIVTIDDSVVDVGITTVFYGIDVASTPDFSSNADLAQVKAITDLVTDVPTAGGIPKAGANNKLPSGWIDWSAWATGLAGKANKDLNNLEPAAENVIRSKMTLRNLGTRSTVGDWTLTGVCVGRPLWICWVPTTITTVMIAVVRVRSGATIGSSPHSDSFYLGRANSFGASNALFVKPTSSTVVIDIDNLTTSGELYAEQI